MVKKYTITTMRKQWQHIGVLIVGLFLILATGMNPLSSRAAPPPRPYAEGVLDGYADLAVGIPYDDPDGEGALQYAGSARVTFGTPNGLSSGTTTRFHQDDLGGSEPDTGSPSEENDRFGYALAAGDFDRDGAMDLAIGVPWEDILDHTNAGAVHVVYGSDYLYGFQLTGRRQFGHQGSSGVQGTPEDWDAFGWSLAVGDFDGNGYDDLAIGAPYETVGEVSLGGCVNVLYGSSSGLTAVHNEDFFQGYDGVEDEAEDGDRFGWALATGDFNGDGYDDLAIGVPYEDVWGEGVEEGGQVHILFGSSDGLTITGQDSQIQNDLMGWPASETGDWFGYALATGDFDSDGYDDLAIVVADESLKRGDTTYARAGAVNVMYGSSSGLEELGSQYWHQDVPDIEEEAEAEDQFGYALAVGDFDGDGYDDLAMGVRHESVGTVDGAGAVNVLYGSGEDGLTTTGQQLWHQDKSGIEGDAEEDDWFGSALAAGDFNGDGRDDLAVGAPGDCQGESSTWNTGEVDIIYSYSSAIGLSGTNSERFIWMPGEGTDAQFGTALAAFPVSPASKGPGGGNIYLPIVLKNS